jgi:hypothetical protein
MEDPTVAFGCLAADGSDDHPIGQPPVAAAPSAQAAPAGHLRSLAAAGRLVVGSRTRAASNGSKAHVMVSRKVFITGGSAGIGKAAALQLAAQGASVVICARGQRSSTGAG